MTVYVILQNWKDYDFRKQNAGFDPRYFNCMDEWEVDFLVKKIQQIYNFIPERQIKQAICKVASTDLSARERHHFVNAVLESLAIPA